MSYLVNFYPVVILLGVMILVHELGHYWAAISVGIRVDTFSIGFGPRLIGFKRGDTDYRISAVPLGGYVRMYGELPGDENAAADPRSFLSKTRWQRAIVVIAGPLMNVVLAIAIMTGLLMYSFPKQVDSADPVITSVDAGSAASRAGVRTGDRVIQIASDRDPNWEDVLNTTALNAGHAIPVVVQRSNTTLNLTVKPELDSRDGVGKAGWDANPDLELKIVEPGAPAAQAGMRAGDLIISIDRQPVLSPRSVVDQVIDSKGKPLDVLFERNGHIQRVSITPAPNSDPKLPWHLGVQVGPREEPVKLPFGSAFVESLKWNRHYAGLIFQTVGSLLERRVSPKSLQGPISIAGMATEAVQAGAVPFLELMAFVSVNLAVMNLLPIPILDGGSLLVLLIEMILQREVSLQVKETAFKLGFVFLMMVVVFVLYNDITRRFAHG